MSLYKARGIVLRTHKLGEADKIITFITASRGKVRAVAKGIRRTKSKFGSRLEPFSCIDMVLYASRRSLDIVTQAELVRPFREIREDINRLAFGSGMLDLVDKVSVEGDPDTALFNLLLRGLEAIAQNPSDRNLKLLLAAFDLKLMSITGYLPKLDACASCGDSSEVLARFSNERGGAICERCFDAAGYGAPVPAGAIRLAGQLLRKRLADVAGMYIDGKVEEEVAQLVADYVAYHVQAKLRSRECLTQLERSI